MCNLSDKNLVAYPQQSVILSIVERASKILTGNDTPIIPLPSDID